MSEGRAPTNHGVDGVGTTRYDAFISYSHVSDGALAKALQQGLQRLAQSWYGARALRVFRDATGLGVSPSLWTSICEALDSARYFVLMSSPESAASEWVGREISRWREEKPAEHILIVLSAGEIEWVDEIHDFDWERSTALHPALRGAFRDEPLYLDLRWARVRPRPHSAARAIPTGRGRACRSHPRTPVGGARGRRRARAAEASTCDGRRGSGPGVAPGGRGHRHLLRVRSTEPGPAGRHGGGGPVAQRRLTQRGIDRKYGIGHAPRRRRRSPGPEPVERGRGAPDPRSRARPLPGLPDVVGHGGLGRLQFRRPSVSRRRRWGHQGLGCGLWAA